MKKVLAVSLMAASVSASAFWNNNAPWSSDGVWQNTPWGPRYVEDNGLIGHNPHSMFTPDWFSEEMDDMMDEFDDDNDDVPPWVRNRGPWGNNTPWGNRGWNNNGPWGNSGPWNNNRWNNRGPWGANGPWNRAPARQSAPEAEPTAQTDND